MHQAMEKIKGGKLLKVKVDVYGGRIKQVQVLGDFFAHPETSIEKIEEQLLGQNIPFDKKKVIECLEEYILRNNFLLIGIDVKAIIRVLLKAIEKQKKDLSEYPQLNKNSDSGDLNGN